jgi:hypothetical protein
MEKVCNAKHNSVTVCTTDTVIIEPLVESHGKKTKKKKKNKEQQ